MNKKIVIAIVIIAIAVGIVLIPYARNRYEISHPPIPGISGSYQWCVDHGGKKWPTKTPYCELNNIHYPGFETPPTKTL